MFTENDIPGASLNGRDPSQLKVLELKRWLQCRAGSTRGLKADLIARQDSVRVVVRMQLHLLYRLLIFRVRAYIDNDWADNVVNPDNNTVAQSSGVVDVQLPAVWQNIKVAYKSQAVPQFGNGQIVEYFVTRTVKDGCPAADFKSMNKSAINLFRCGHVQNIEVSADESRLFMRAKCLPEMRKDRVYKLLLTMRKTTLDILSAECGCPGGKGPTATCKHIGALCYGFQNFCEQGSIPDFLTCTQQLHEWNRPRPRVVNPIPVEGIRAHQTSISAPPKLPRNPRIPNNFDPRPVKFRQSDPDALENLRTDLIAIGQPCALLSILIPSTKKALHDHTYCLKVVGGEQQKAHEVEKVYLREPCPYNSDELKDMCKKVKKDLFVSQEERVKIELNTRQQSGCSLWYEVRYKRITGSKAGQILKQVSCTPALLKNVLYPKHLNPVPAPIKWGRDNEAVACSKYLEYMTEHHHNVTVKQCGFFIHPQEPWLGASPDGVVIDHCCTPSKGLLEIKCPYSIREITPREACDTVPSFYCTINDGVVKLKREHQYYHQVQLQLFVCSSEYDWCDP